MTVELQSFMLKRFNKTLMYKKIPPKFTNFEQSPTFGLENLRKEFLNQQKRLRVGSSVYISGVVAWLVCASASWFCWHASTLAHQRLDAFNFKQSHLLPLRQLSVTLIPRLASSRVWICLHF